MNGKAEMPHPLCRHFHDIPGLHPVIVPTEVERAKRAADGADHQHVGLVPLQERFRFQPLSGVVQIPGLSVIGVVPN